jgi:hypothetical protein
MVTKTKHYFKDGKVYKGKVHRMNGQIHTGAKLKKVGNNGKTS